MLEQFTGPTGKIFTFIGTEPYTRLNGTCTTLKVWRTMCSRCNEFFVVRTPGESTDEALPHYNQFRRLHCDAHKATPQEALARARQALSERGIASRLLTSLNKARSKVSDADVAEVRRLAAQGAKPRDLMLVFPLAESTLRSIINGTRR